MVKQTISKQGKKRILIILQLFIAFICLSLGIGMLQNTNKDIKDVKKIAPENMLHIATYLANVSSKEDVDQTKTDEIDIENIYKSIKKNNNVSNVGTFLVNNIIPSNSNININEESIPVISIDSDFLKFSTFNVVQGRNLNENDMENNDKIPVIIGNKLSKAIHIGSIIKSNIYNYEKEMIVVGILPQKMRFWGGGGSFLSNSLINLDYGIIAPIQNEQNSSDTFATRVLRNTVIQLKDVTKKDDFINYVEQNLNENVTKYGYYLKVKDLESEINQIYLRNKVVIYSSISLALIILILSTFGLIGVIMTSIVQRKKEFGIRYAIGATPKHLASLILLETFFLYVTASIFGLIFMTLLKLIIYNDSILYFDYFTFLFTFGVLFINATVSALFPAVYIVNMRPVKLIIGGIE